MKKTIYIILFILCYNISYSQKEILLIELNGDVYNNIGKIHVYDDNFKIYNDNVLTVQSGKKIVKSEYNYLYYTSITRDLLIAKDKNNTIISHDSGISWNETVYNDFPIYPMYKNFGMSKENSGYGYTDNNFYLFNSESNSWIFINKLYTERKGFNMLISPIIYNSDKTIFFASKVYSRNLNEKFIFLRSVDNGKSWSNVKNSFTFNVIGFYNVDNIFYLVNDFNEIYCSNDNGETWILQNKFEYEWIETETGLLVNSITSAPFIFYKSIVN